MDSIADYLSWRPWFTIPGILVLGVFLFRRISLIYQLRHIRGPLLYRFTGIPHSLALLSGNNHIWYADLHRKYGEIVVVSPSMVITSSPELWARSNTYPGYKKSAWFYKAVRYAEILDYHSGSPFYNTYNYREDNLFTQTDTEKHDLRRKQMIRGYAGIENLTLDNDIEVCVVKLLNLISTRYAGQRRAMDLAQKTHFFTMDVISTIGFGKCYNLLTQDADPEGYIESLHRGLEVAHRQVAFGSWRLNWIPFLGPKPKSDPDSNTGFYKMSMLNAAMVEARETEFREQDSLGIVPRQDMLTSFMKRGLLGADLKTENTLQIVAGSDTTSGAFNGIMLYVLTNPICYKALQKEIDEAVASGKAPRSSEVIKYTQARELPYLQAVILEGLRMFPPVQNQNSRDVPPEGDTVTIEGEEVFLPGGSMVIPSYVPMHQNKTVYGDVDADIFRPERWIEETDEAKLTAMKNEVNLGFGHGRWMCLGKPIAMHELSVVTFELFRHFDWRVVNPEKPWKHTLLMGLHAVSDMWVHVEERTKPQQSQNTESSSTALA